MRAQHAAFGLTKVLRAGKFFQACSKAAEAMRALPQVRDDIEALTAEAERCKQKER